MPEKKLNLKIIMAQLKAHADTANVEGMKRFGIAADRAFGVRVPIVRSIARSIGKNHALAIELWDTGIHEAQLLCSMTADIKQVTETQINKWLKGFASWDMVDQFCLNLFWKLPDAHERAIEWAARKEEFVKRTGFSLMAVLAVHDKKAPDAAFEKFLPIIKQASTDDRNFVKKAVNWALRQIGKRNGVLCKKALGCSREILAIDSRAARWIATDAIRELEPR
jgi:3-methyladenine DNA glycosylase AlkD